MTRKQLYDIMQESPEKNTDDKMVFLDKQILELTKCPESQLDKLKHALSHFKYEFKRRWIAANYKHDRFLKKNEQWLENTQKFPMWTIGKPGRPSKEFGKSSDRSK
ncbi:hypothetical protein JTB14_012145 [Gonioctena quinquepunctata]|nr:hypothetical protein JTB14_012145 [Gonioctena quinquepunctata]